ncbi:MAG: glucuronate isomerase [Pyrinomonadaceae bacterium]
MGKQVEDGVSRPHGPTDARELRREVDEVVASAPVIDMHTHLFPPRFGALSLYGIDELLNYHYLIAELFRAADVTPEQFWSLPKTRRSDLIWESLFVRRTPLSEATRGVVAVLTSLGLDARATDLRDAREFFAAQRAEDYVDRVLKTARVESVVMTNDPFDAQEARLWEARVEVDPRFRAALRIDPMLVGWRGALPALASQGFDVREDLGGRSATEARRFLDLWVGRIGPLYLAVSLPDDFNFPADADPVRARVLGEIILPTCREHNLPLALMIGVRRGVNPRLRSAGDGLGRADVSAVERICAAHPDNRFLVTFLSRENQHELCVSARKFPNLMPFGCWWFLNNPSIISEVTRERLELLGTSFIAQHSDARVLDQLIYKWAHSRRVIADALFEAYHALLTDGRAVTRDEIERDAARLFVGNFTRWVGL